MSVTSQYQQPFLPHNNISTNNGANSVTKHAQPDDNLITDSKGFTLSTLNRFSALTYPDQVSWSDQVDAEQWYGSQDSGNL